MRTHHHVFERLIDRCRELPPVAAAVVYPLSDVALRGAVEGAQQGLIRPVLIGPETPLRELARTAGLDLSRCTVVAASDDAEAAASGVDLCRRGECEALMKGSLHTDAFLHPVLDERTGLRTKRRLSHVFVFDVPTYPKMLMVTDAAVNIYPTLEDKVDIVQNAIDLAQVLGEPSPRVAILSALETVTPRITSTIEAAALCKMADRGQITGGIVDGPLAFDNAVSPNAAAIKHLQSPVAGQADILVAPDLESGNMLAKQLEYLAEAEAAGIVVGARVPMVLTSRADSAKTRLASCAIAVLAAHGRRRDTSRSIAS